MKLTLLLVLLWIQVVVGGPFAAMVAYGLCQTGCNTVAVACYAAGGAVFGTVTAGVGVAPAIIGCNVALGVCMTSCATVAGIGVGAPTP
ncbi:unnamed protein product [Discosporangium mesarthrocarpum]